MNEQATAASEITRAAESMRRKADETAKGLKEQAQAMKDLVTATANTTKQIKLDHPRQHTALAGGDALLNDMSEVRRSPSATPPA